MTYEEKQKAIIRAKRWIQDVIDYHQDVLDGEEPDNTEKAIFEECEVILNALEKQIPKKPIFKDNDGIRYTDSYRCPTCGGAFSGTGIANYCYHCGQVIDWSDEV